jgi:hypothetical protein
MKTEKKGPGTSVPVPDAFLEAHTALRKILDPFTKKKGMKGKACFNFKAPDPELFKELSALTKAGYERWKRDGLV